MTRLRTIPTRHRRRALSVAGQAGRRVRFPPSGVLRPADPFNLSGEGALSHRLREQESRHPFKVRGLLLKFLTSLHPASFLRKP